MLAMAGVTIANVVVRNLTGETLAFAEELNRFLIVFVCFVGLSYGAGRGRHIRMTAIADALPPEPRRGLRVVVCATTAALLAVLGWYALSYAVDVDRRSPVLGVPLRWVYLLAPLGLWMGAVQYALTTARNLRGDGIWASYDTPDGHEDSEVATGVPADVGDPRGDDPRGDDPRGDDPQARDREGGA